MDSTAETLEEGPPLLSMGESQTSVERYLLQQICEEAAEVIQRASKASRFGLEEIEAGQDLNNAERMALELADLNVAIRVLCTETNVDIFVTSEYVEERESRLRNSMAYSSALGRV